MVFVYWDSFILTDEKRAKIERKVEVLRLKNIALTTLSCLFEKHNGKKLTKRVFDDVTNSFNTGDTKAVITTTDYGGNIEIGLSGNLTYSEGRYSFISNEFKKSDRLDYERLKTEMDKVIENNRKNINELESCLKKLEQKLKKAKHAYDELIEISKSLPYEVRQEFNVLKEIN